jgi:hypothetical protein
MPVKVGCDHRLAPGDLGQASRLAAATAAYLCIEDEAGQTLRPPKARTYAGRGRTPVLAACGKGSGRVSAAGMTCYGPPARSRFSYRIRLRTRCKVERRSMSEADYADLNTHKGASMSTFTQAHDDWLAIIWLSFTCRS